MYTFDVALWQVWPIDFPFVAFVEAPSYGEALEQAMRVNDLFKCARAAVALCGSSVIVRYDRPVLTAEQVLEADVLSV